MRKRTVILLATGILIAAGYLLPERVVVPVQNASSNDWHPDSFWFEPWGTSGVHKGIDIFGAKGTPVVSTVDGLVVFAGDLRKGGNVALVLGPSWRLHYFAHLDTVDVSAGSWVASGNIVGRLGDSGNAKGKPPHLHYAIVRMIPLPWKMDRSTQGYKKAFFIDPDRYLRAALAR